MYDTGLNIIIIPTIILISLKTMSIYCLGRRNIEIREYKLVYVMEKA